MISEFKMEKGYLPQLVYAVALPFFFLGCTLLYNPFDIEGYYSFGSLSFRFHLMMISCIILLCTLISRFFLSLVLNRRNLTWIQYGEWCICEILIMSAFVALYTVLFKGTEGGYFVVLPDSLKFISLTLVFPYSILIFILIVKIKNEELLKKELSADNSLIRFYDEHRRLKLSIAPSAILYVKSEFNYVKIHYLDGIKVKDFMLRASMKSLEDLGSKNLVRCQRSYFVNPEHISVLRKDTQGFIYAEMNIPGIEAVPVSKQYYESLSALL